MDKKEILSLYKKRYNNYNDEYRKIDNAILPLVDFLRKQGFITFASCASHILNYEGKPCFSGQAYVAFFFADEDYDKFIALKNHKFPKSKYYKIVVDTFGNNPNQASIDIFFNTRHKRIFHLKKIYKSLGIEFEGQLYLEAERECLNTTRNPEFTIFKEGVN